MATTSGLFRFSSPFQRTSRHFKNSIGILKIKDCVKVASDKLVNPYHELTISFGKGVGMAK